MKGFLKKMAYFIPSWSIVTDSLTVVVEKLIRINFKILIAINAVSMVINQSINPDKSAIKLQIKLIFK